MSNRSKVVDLIGDVRTGLGAPRSAAHGPSAALLIFRPIRPRRYIDRMARIIIDARSAEFGEEILRRDIQLIEQDLLRFGVDPVTAAREVRGLEVSIRTAMWWVMFGREVEG